MPPVIDPASLRAELTACREQLDPYPQDRFTGSGIVICAGGASVFTNAYVLIHVLRTLLRCALPIEVWHLGDGEMSARMRWLLRNLSAEPVDAQAVMADQGVPVSDGWQLKSFALAHSSFARVLLLDADIVPERDPAELFEWPEFEATGAVLWPDICSLTDENQIWSACGLASRTTRAVESGQVLIDKSRHWDALQIIVFLNAQREHTYRMVYGDKDLFLIGFLLTGQPYHVVPHLPLTDQPWCLFQRDFAGDRLFQHRCGAKWRYRGPQVDVPGFRHGEACEEALATLRRLWSGRIFHAPARSPEALAEEARLSAVRTVELVTPGEATLTLDLLEGGDIIDGSLSDFAHWYCVGGEPLALVLLDRFQRAMRFEFQGEGCWAEGSAAASVLIEGHRANSGHRAAASDTSWDWAKSHYRFDDDDR
ncbi:Mannosyltransferase putative [Methylorubrum salsuginis]|uniref:Mannosyltransferase putative n=2 Tax=Methylorubrum salsuginis TaxID=414703 RepID=A0A1I4MQE3_9HYPH|nr:Mannosyltransferase putative [Methylorubrum salsuginis]